MISTALITYKAAAFGWQYAYFTPVGVQDAFMARVKRPAPPDLDAYFDYWELQGDDTAPLFTFIAFDQAYKRLLVSECRA